VLDGEVVVARAGALDFEALQMRIHPAASRVKLLAQEIPTSIVFFDLLAEGDHDLRPSPFQERRRRLEAMLARATPPIHVTPATTDRDTAGDWSRRFEGAGLDGVMAKPENGAYEPNKRVMLKVKHEREWRRGRGRILGTRTVKRKDRSPRSLHDRRASSITSARFAAKRRELKGFLAPYQENALIDHPWKTWMDYAEEFAAKGQRVPGGMSRWSQGKDLSWIALRPELVVQVAYDHMQGSRFRHTAQFRRWRTDKKPQDCTFAQLEVVPPHELETIFAGGR
jgi:ATP-dependent DNA ligase